MTDRPHERFVAQFTRKRGRKYILDGFDHEFYLLFDFEEAEGSKPDTCDVLIQCLPEDEGRLIRVLANCRQSHVLRFLFALGIQNYGLAAMINNDDFLAALLAYRFAAEAAEVLLDSMYDDMDDEISITKREARDRARQLLSEAANALDGGEPF